MIELGQLEKEYKTFAEKNVRLIAVSNDDLETAKQTQNDFPHLEIVSDPEQNLAKAVAVVHVGQAPGGGDTSAPTTFLVDGDGYVRHVYRPERFLTRLRPDELLAIINQTWKP